MNNRKRMIHKAKLIWHKKLLRWNKSLMDEVWKIVYCGVAVRWQNDLQMESFL
jgi:hypothetical protein